MLKPFSLSMTVMCGLIIWIIWDVHFMMDGFPISVSVTFTVFMLILAGLVISTDRKS